MSINIRKVKKGDIVRHIESGDVGEVIKKWTEADVVLVSWTGDPSPAMESKPRACHCMYLEMYEE